MIQLIPMVAQARWLYAYSRQFAQDRGLDASCVTLNKCVDIVESYCYKALADHMLWINHERDRASIQPLNIDLYKGQVHEQEVDLNVLVSAKMLNPEVEVHRSESRLFPWYTDRVDVDDDLSDDFYCTILDLCWLKVDSIVESVISKPTWIIWRVGRHGQELFLESHQDYRICDWERLHTKAEPARLPEYAQIRTIRHGTPLQGTYAAAFSQKELQTENVRPLFKPNQALPVQRIDDEHYTDSSDVELHRVLQSFQNTAQLLKAHRVAALMDPQPSRPGVVGERQRTPDGRWIAVYKEPQDSVQPVTTALQQLLDRKEVFVVRYNELHQQYNAAQHPQQRHHLGRLCYSLEVALEKLDRQIREQQTQALQRAVEVNQWLENGRSLWDTRTQGVLERNERRLSLGYHNGI